MRLVPYLARFGGRIGFDQILSVARTLALARRIRAHGTHLIGAAVFVSLAPAVTPQHVGSVGVIVRGAR